MGTRPPMNGSLPPMLGVCPPKGVDRAVISSILFRRPGPCALAAIALFPMALVWPNVASAQTQPSTYSRTSVSGSFLAARHASTERDSAAAANYYRAALRGDPRNTDLLSKAFLAVLANGEVEEA